MDLAVPPCEVLVLVMNSGETSFWKRINYNGGQHLHILMHLLAKPHDDVYEVATYRRDKHFFARRLLHVRMAV